MTTRRKTIVPSITRENGNRQELTSCHKCRKSLQIYGDENGNCKQLHAGGVGAPPKFRTTPVLASQVRSKSRPLPPVRLMQHLLGANQSKRIHDCSIPPHRLNASPLYR